MLFRVVMLVIFSQWSIKLHSGSSESLLQYKANLTSIAAPLEKLTEHSEVFWVVQGVYQWQKNISKSKRAI